MIAAYPAPYPSRPAPKLAAGALALCVHIVFLALLFAGMSWQTDHPEPVMVDLWDALPAPAVESPPQPEPPQPVPEPVVPEPVPEPVRPEPIKTEPIREPKPAPRPVATEPPAPRPADIALEKRQAEQARQEALRALQAAEEKALAEAARAEAEALRVARDRQLAEQRRRELLRQMEEDERMMHRMAEEAAARETRAAEARAVAQRQSETARTVDQYRERISAAVRGNTRLPDDLKGNPEVRFLVKVLPSGEVFDIRRTQSSGNPAYDEAVERAIRMSSPLPLPDEREARAAFIRQELSIVHRARE